DNALRRVGVTNGLLYLTHLTPTFPSGGGTNALADGDYGDITVGGSGTTMEIDAGVVGSAELASSLNLTNKTTYLQSGTRIYEAGQTNYLMFDSTTNFTRLDIRDAQDISFSVAQNGGSFLIADKNTDTNLTGLTLWHGSTIRRVGVTNGLLYFPSLGASFPSGG